MKKMVKKLRIMALVSLLMTTPLSGIVAAETTECTVIDSIPTVISQQGVYCLKNNLATTLATGYAIAIATNNVTIDFNGFKLGNLGAGGDSEMEGVYAFNHNNIVIKNANIRGFRFGINLTGGTGHKVIDSTFDGNFEKAIYADGQIVIADNTIVNTGGRAFQNAWGISLGTSADGSIVRQNVIRDVNPASVGYSAYGILTYGTINVTVEGNTLSGLADETTTSYGIYHSYDTGSNVYDNNKIFGFDTCIYADQEMGSCLLRNNIVDCTVNYFNGSSNTIIDLNGNYPAIP